jgi:hypothetical protein
MRRTGMPNPTKTKLVTRVEFALAAFRAMTWYCPHRYSRIDTDCHHPDIDVACMLCSPCNCPLLLVAEEEMPETDLYCLRGEDPEL